MCVATRPFASGLRCQLSLTRQSLDAVARADGAQYILNSAIPHEGQELTPPGLYGPWGTVDNPGWHGDYTIVRSNAALLLPPFRRSSP